MDAAARLGVPPNASPDIVRAAFARQVRAVHPDVADARQGDAGTRIAALIVARDDLLARAGSRPQPKAGPVVFYQHRDFAGWLRALVYRRKRPRRHLS